jgi:hypothetical protein
MEALIPNFEHVQRSALIAKPRSMFRLSATWRSWPARGAHNPKVPRSKRGVATFFALFCRTWDLASSYALRALLPPSSPDCDAFCTTCDMPSISLNYLQLPTDYDPSPSESPIQFLSQHLRSLPPNIARAEFSGTTSAKQRTTIPAVRNRRLKHVRSRPSAFEYENARAQWPLLWRGPPEKPGAQHRAAADDERRWVEKEFIGGWKPHVQKLGELLAGYEEEREGERDRVIRRQQAQDAFIPEEDTDSEEEEDGDAEPIAVDIPDTLEEAKEAFQRLVTERFIYGTLDVCNTRFTLRAFCLSSHSRWITTL